jgi:hypothetical protein
LQPLFPGIAVLDVRAAVALHDVDLTADALHDEPEKNLHDGELNCCCWLQRFRDHHYWPVKYDAVGGVDGRLVSSRIAGSGLT